jgi:hypothetical protein
VSDKGVDTRLPLDRGVRVGGAQEGVPATADLTDARLPGVAAARVGRDRVKVAVEYPFVGTMEGVGVDTRLAVALVLRNNTQLPRVVSACSSAVRQAGCRTYVAYNRYALCTFAGRVAAAHQALSNDKECMLNELFKRSTTNR